MDFSNGETLQQQISIKSPQHSIKGNKSYTTFSVFVTNEGDYKPSFWLMASMLPNGECTRYQVEVNGNLIENLITPSKNNWQLIGLDNEGIVHLTAGYNKISIIACLPEVPAVEYVNIDKVQDYNRVNIASNVIVSNAYDEYIQEIKNNQLRKSNRMNLQGPTILNDTICTYNTLESNQYHQANYPKSFSKCIMGETMKYTFFTKLYYSQGDLISLDVSSYNNFPFYIEVFLDSDENHYSTSELASTGHGDYEMNAPFSGWYFVRIRSYYNGSTGLGNIIINNMRYDDIPIYSIGYEYSQPTDQIYDNFTCNSDYDTQIWIQGIDDAIVHWNGAYAIDSLGWDVEARTHIKFDTPTKGVLFSAYSSYRPIIKFNAYIGCPMLPANTLKFFPALNAKDAIQSAPANPLYNCFAWAGGIWNKWEDPRQATSPYNVGDTLKSFDKYLEFRGYTRDGANAENAKIALWGIVDNNNKVIKYTHMSIRNISRTDTIGHGYDYESKLGDFERVFHPENALQGSSYGRIVEYYRPIYPYLLTRSLLEDISDGAIIYENVVLTNSESDYINKHISELDSNIKSEFNRYFTKWSNTLSINSDFNTDCTEYKNMIQLCKIYKDLRYLVYDKLAKGNVKAIKLIQDIDLPYHNTELAMVKEDNAKASDYINGQRIYRSLEGNTLKFVKYILSSEMPSFSKKTFTTEIQGLEYSNEDNFDIKIQDNIAYVKIKLNNSANIGIAIYSLNGQIIKEIKKQQLDKGSHHLMIENIPSGTYLVLYQKNGNMDVRKVTIK